MQPADTSIPSTASKSRTVPESASDSSWLSTQTIQLIANISPNQNQWVIRARVSNKSQIRPYRNNNGQGKLFSMELCDDSGKIRAAAFQKECEKFYDIIQEGKVYYISRCRLKTANKQFSKRKNDYEIIFSSATVVAECIEDTESVSCVKYDFVSIKDISSKPVDSLLDVIGVCKSTASVQTFTSKGKRIFFTKRELTLVDSSGCAINLALWGTEAEKFDGSLHPVIAVKNVRLVEFRGRKSLSCLTSSTMQLDPNVAEAHLLRSWYNNVGADADVTNVTDKSHEHASGNNEWITVSEAKRRKLDKADQGGYYNLLGVLILPIADYAVYKACPQEQCNKKLLDQENGLFGCEQCNQEYSKFKHRLRLEAKVVDPTGEERIVAFNEASEMMLGKKAEDIHELLEFNKRAYVELFEEVSYKTFVFKFRAEMDEYTEKIRLRFNVTRAMPVDYKDANARLIKNIKLVTGVEI